MFSTNTKMLLFLAWAIAVCLVALAAGVSSGQNWMIVACVAIVPPSIARAFWRSPERTISESIQEARR